LAVITMRELLEAGCHFGHQTKRWNPKMKKYIFGSRNGIHIIDLQRTVGKFQEAYDFAQEVSRGGGCVLFVGTKRQAQEAIKLQAERCGMPYVNQRWLGGTLTNFQTIHKSIQKLKRIEESMLDGTYEGLTKKELLKLQREKDKLEKYFGGIKDMGKLPEVIFFIDIRKETIALKEAIKAGIASISIVDTNCDPDGVDFPIPGNDDAIRAIKLITTRLADAVLEGKAASKELIEEMSEESLTEEPQLSARENDADDMIKVEGQ